MRRSTLWTCGLAACVGLLLSAPSDLRAETTLEASSTTYRSFDLPEGFSLRRATLDSTYAGETMLAGTALEKRAGDAGGKVPVCTVILVSGGEGGSARAWKYRPADDVHTQCAGALPHPDGGFFVRGVRAGAGDDQIAGFTARLGPNGEEKWLTNDTEIASSEEFQGTYTKPGSVMAYNAEADQLFAVTLGKISLKTEEKKITQAAIYAADDGGLLTRAARIGRSGGFNQTQKVFALTSSRDFLVQNSSPARSGVRLYRYNSRFTDAFEPLGELWSERNVHEVMYGPRQRIHLLWSTEESGSTQTRMAVVDEEAKEVWSQTWLPSVEIDGEEKTLGSPEGMMVGREHVVVLYRKQFEYFLRVVDADEGYAFGVVPLADLTGSGRFLALTKGKDGAIKLLEKASQKKKLTERKLSFETSGAPADSADAGSSRRDAGSTTETDAAASDPRPGDPAGPADVSEAGDAIADASKANGASSKGGGESGCHASGQSRPLGAFGWIGFGLLAFLALRHRDASSRQTNADHPERRG